MVMEDAKIRFCWTLRSEDAERIRQSLGAAHPQQLEEREPAAAIGSDPDIEDLLLSVGLHLDQEVAEIAGSHTQLDGVTAVAALTKSLDEVMREAPSGFIVDTRFDSVHIDQHPSVGRGTIVLVDRDGARLLGSRQEAAVSKALADAEAALPLSG